ncbi:MAG: HEAT repeat domain-containing protein [Planctomycetales bacterium]|nr:HEAT repeat domain-containing protein [Planctomycetales bacterium]
MDEPERLVSLLGHPDFRVRENAERRLEALGERALPALRLARDHRDPEVRARVRRLLAALGETDRDEAARILGEARAKLLQDRPEVREEGAREIARVGHLAPEKLREMATRDADWRVRRAVAEALPRVRSAEAPPILIAQLEDEDTWVRSGAGASLRALTGQEIPTFKVAEWKAWWEKAQDTWRPPALAPPPSPADPPVVRDPPPPPPPRRAPPG